ncbi:MAG: hypothetical protein D3904_04040 [Candidatus Electrothrix sp. EH2]|nr:hypothetical protein [Candidatus Electrothrix sp. EH2]
MNIETLIRFFMWCTILNVVLLAFSFFIFAFAGDFVYRMHSKWFSMPRETFNVIFYSFIGAYKLFVYVFNIVPWIALIIIA